MDSESYTLALPSERSSCAVFTSPHSGSAYSEAFLAQTRLGLPDIRLSEDAFVDRFISMAPEFGSPALSAVQPRVWVDLNRSESELDPALIEGVGARSAGHRVESGLGVIPRVVGGGVRIYSGKISRHEAARRIESHYRPFHRRLDRLLAESLALFGEAILLDFHSMPREAVRALGRQGVPAPNLVLGNRFGASCSSALMDSAEAIFARAGFSVCRNVPFSGGHITRRHGRPFAGVHAIQVEIDRSLYMDERRVAPNSGFGPFLRVMSGVVAELSALGSFSARLAAE